MNKIKIAFIISNLGQGGAEKQFVELIKNIDKTCFEIHLYLYAFNNKMFYYEILSIEDIIITKNELKNKNIFIKILEALLYLRSILKHNSYDIVFTSLFMNNLFVYIVAPKRYNNKLVLNNRTSLSYSNKYQLIFYKWMIRKSYIVFNSNKSLLVFLNKLKWEHHSRVKLIYNGFEKTMNNDHSNTNGDILFGGLGRQSNEKNFMQLCRVFNKLSEREKILLYLKGTEGNQTMDICKIADGNKRIFLFEAGNTLEFFNSVHVLVIPSLFEGCPNVLFEALMNKKLCIISKGANSDNFVTHLYNGIVYDGTDDDLLDKMELAINLLLNHKGNEIINTGFEYGISNFSMEKMVNQYSKLFSDIYENY